MDENEIKERIRHGLFHPVVRTAAEQRIPLRELKRELERAYYHETRQQNLSMKEVMELMDIQISKTAQLSKQLKGSFIASAEMELERQVEYLLWSEPLSLKKITQHFDRPEDEIAPAIETLLEEARIEAVKKGRNTVYRLKLSPGRRVWDNWLARLDGLNRALESLRKVVAIRFLGKSGSALARTVTFHIKRKDLPLLDGFYDEVIWPFLEELDSEVAPGDEDIEVVDFSVLWSREE